MFTYFILKAFIFCWNGQLRRHSIAPFPHEEGKVEGITSCDVNFFLCIGLMNLFLTAGLHLYLFRHYSGLKYISLAILNDVLRQENA